MKQLVIFAIALIVCKFCAIAQEEGGRPVKMNNYTIVQEAYESRDIEAIKRICQHVSQQDILIVNLSETPPSLWKDEVVLVLLEAPWPGDRVEGKPTPPGSSAPLRSFHLVVDLLSSVLPDENLKMNDRETYAKLSTHNGRKRLAEKFKEAVRKQEPINRQHGTGKEESPSGETLKSTPAETAKVSSPPGPNPVADKPTIPSQSSKTWIWVLAALLVVGFGLILKIRRAK